MPGKISATTVVVGFFGFGHGSLALKLA